MTSMASKAIADLELTTVLRQAARVRHNDSGVRDNWSAIPWTPAPANKVTVDTPDGGPRSTESGSQGDPASSSAKQKLYLPGFPSVARSTSPGRPPPTLRITNWR